MKDKYYFYLSIIILSISLSLYIYNNSKKNYGSIEKVKKQEIIKININTAKGEDLIQIPGIGEKLAKSIIEYRNKNGDFESIDELLKIKGIKEKKLNSIKEFIYVQSNSE